MRDLRGGALVASTHKYNRKRTRSEAQKRYNAEERWKVNKSKRAAREERRAKPLPCGHGSRYLSPYDGGCRWCYREGTPQKYEIHGAATKRGTG